MKKYLWVALLVIGLASVVWAQAPVKASATQTASALITRGPVNFHGITIITDGTNAVTVDIYGNTAASGTKLIPQWIVTSSASNRAQTYSLYPPVRSEDGIYVNISVAGGGTASYMVYYGG
jgi:hypothetical protein